LLAKKLAAWLPGQAAEENLEKHLHFGNLAVIAGDQL